jgi:hypothetical protein
MDAKATPTVAGELAEAKRGFEQWRRSRKQKRRIPERLWRMAVKAAAVHGVSRTARWLGLNPTRLKQRMDAPVPDEVSQEGPRFVEWPWPVAAATAECLLEAEDQRGNKLRIHLKGEATAQAVSLGRMLWKG